MAALSQSRTPCISWLFSQNPTLGYLPTNKINVPRGQMLTRSARFFHLQSIRTSLELGPCYSALAEMPLGDDLESCSDVDEAKGRIHIPVIYRDAQRRALLL